MPSADSDESAFELDSEQNELLQSYAKSLLARNKGLFTEYTDEQELIDLTTSQTMVIHFYKPTFAKCVHMNKALHAIAPKFPGIKFGCINVLIAPHMSESLKIKALPFLAFFKDGYFIDQHVGYEKLGNTNTPFALEALERYISNSQLNSNICSQ